jgi:carboxylesterase type B
MEELAMNSTENANKRLDHFGFTYKLLLGFAICVVALSSAPTASAGDSSHPPIALTESGVVIGSTTDGVNQFLGIPYAAPPIGSLRWRPPKHYGFFPAQQMQLSDAMVSYWTQFAKNGDPNSSGEPLWSPYSASNDEFQSLIPPAPVVESNFDSSHKCSTFWDTF